MPFAVELALDAVAAATVRATWDELARAGVDYMASCGARPHVSLGIWEEMNIRAAADTVHAFARDTPPVPIVLERASRFPGGVVYLALRPDTRLAALQQRFHGAMIHARGGWPHYAPGTWVPHCTMAMDYPPRLQGVAERIVASMAVPLTARLEAIEIIEFRPVRTRFARPLSGAAATDG